MLNLKKIILNEVSKISFRESRYEIIKDEIKNYENSSDDTRKKDAKKTLYDNFYSHFLQNEVDSEVYNSNFNWDFKDQDYLSNRYNFVKKLKEMDEKSGNKVQDLIKSFNKEIKSTYQGRKDIKFNDVQGWFQIDLNNKNDTLSKTINSQQGQVHFRRHNLYTTVKSNEINFQTKKISYKSLYEFINNFKNFTKDLVDEFYDLNEIPGSKYFVSKFKIPNIDDIESDKYVIKSDNILFRYISFNDNLKIYFSNVSLQNNSNNNKDYMDFVEEIRKIVLSQLQKHNLVSVKRSRSDIGIDFQREKDDGSGNKKDEKFSYGQVVGLVLTNTILNNDNIKKYLVASIENKKLEDVRSFINSLIQKVEDFVSKHENLEKIMISLTKAKEENII